ncbi:MAG: efflux transporter outer membrane subunit [Planctomycetota bacterium]|nr:MAG: efflux transporter outer membrane subunit [Planctomycetota bacterium]
MTERLLRPLPTFLLILAGCVEPRPAPDPVRELAPPATWTAATATGEDAVLADGWWRDFAAADLDEAVRSALEANGDLAAARARVAQAAALARQAAGDRWPGIDASASASRSRRNFIGLPVPGARDGVFAVESESDALSLDLSWEVDLWGRLDAAAKVAVGGLQAAAADWQAARLSLAGQVTRAWLALAAAEERVELAREARDLAAEQLEQERTALAHGRSGAAAVAGREAALAAAEEALLAAEQARRASARALEVLCGRYPDGSLRAGPLPELPPAPPAGLPAELLGRRPDLAAAEARLRAALAGADQAEAALYPALRLTASGGTATNSLAELLNGDFKVWNLAAGITAPIFHGDRLRAGLAAAEARAEEARSSFLQAGLRAFAEVEDALDAEARLRRRQQEVERARAAAEAAAAAVDRRFAAGLAGASELIAARESLRQARAAELENRLALLLNRVDLYLALGGGFSHPER